jgi:tripartite-type tricarboxylate transporter receptor subunit TctC
VGSAQRSPLYPNTPTLAELGLKGFDTGTTHGFWAPAGTPQPIIDRMNSAEVTKVIEDNHRLAQTMDISGTPTFVVGGTMVRGYVPLDAMQDIVAEQRANAG